VSNSLVECSVIFSDNQPQASIMNDSMNSVLFLFISGLEYISLCLEFIPKILVSIKLCFSIRVNLLKIDLLSLII